MNLNLTHPTANDVLANPDNYSFLRKIGIETYRFNPDVGDELKLLVVDFETTGFEAGVDEAIEIGLTLVSYSPSLQRLTAILENYQAFECPVKPITEETTNITGITQEMVNNHSFDEAKVKSLALQAQFLVAHNAKFDRPFWDHRFPELSNLRWACSASGVNWYSKHFSSRALEFLAMKHHFTYDAHRAASDTVATAVILAQGGNFAELHESLERSSIHVLAYGSPFECKDKLKARKYDWMLGQDKVWHKLIDESELEQERQWLDELYHEGSEHAAYRLISAYERFKKEV